MLSALNTSFLFNDWFFFMLFFTGMPQAEIEKYGYMDDLKNDIEFEQVIADGYICKICLYILTFNRCTINSIQINHDVSS